MILFVIAIGHRNLKIIQSRKKQFENNNFEIISLQNKKRESMNHISSLLRGNADQNYPLQFWLKCFAILDPQNSLHIRKMFSVLRPPALVGRKHICLALSLIHMVVPPPRPYLSRELELVNPELLFLPTTIIL